MASRLEMAKFEVLLQRPPEKAHFQATFERCRLLSKSLNTQATDGELMAVCAYQTGRQYVKEDETRIYLTF